MIGGADRQQDERRDDETDQVDRTGAEVVARTAQAPAAPEREPTIGPGVDGHGRRHGDDVREHRAERFAEGQEQPGGDRGADRSDQSEDHELATHLVGELGAPVGGTVDASGAAEEPPRHAGHAGQVPPGRLCDPDAAVGIVDPVDGHLVDAQPVVLGDEQQLGVEEPLVVVDLGQEGRRGIGSQGLEAALGVVEVGREHGVQQQVVGAGDELAFGTARHRRARRQP